MTTDTPAGKNLYRNAADMFLWALLAATALFYLSAPAKAQAPSGSTAFCLFEIPPDGDKRFWINLGIVQYIEMRPGSLRVYYGGGNFGGGHEQRWPIANHEEGAAIIKRMQAAAAACASAQPELR